MASSCNQTRTNILSQNVYYLYLPLFVLDVIRMFQDHPKYKKGINECDIVEILQQEKFANGDLATQVESAIKSLELTGYLRNINGAYRTLGPLSKLASAKNIKQRNAAWDRIKDKF